LVSSTRPAVGDGAALISSLLAEVTQKSTAVQERSEKILLSSKPPGKDMKGDLCSTATGESVLQGGILLMPDDGFSLMRKS
jgi:hypothetical protein